jgi:hypothetical protein
LNDKEQGEQKSAEDEESFATRSKIQTSKLHQAE